MAPHSAAGASVVRQRLTLAEDLVDQTVRLRLLRVHEEVPFHVGADLLDRLAGALGVDPVQLLARLQDLAGMDLDIGRLPLRPARGLMDHYPGVGQREALALRAG